MKSLALLSARTLVLATACATLLAANAAVAHAQDDPPAEAGRIASISGNVSIQPVGADDWGQAYPNLPFGPGDRIFTDTDGRAEIQVGQTFLRIGPNSDVSMVNDTQFGISFGVAQGSVHLHSFGLWPRQLFDVNTPNGNAEFGRAGDMRIDVYPTDGATIFTNLGDFADITAAGDFRQDLQNGESLELSGSNPVTPQWLQAAAPDDLDAWSQDRDRQLSRVASYRYVSPEIPGAADLDAHGDWQPNTEYGAVWFPRDVSADWAPYHNGHWVDRDPWGWVWVEDESWGYAPFHYGRWVSYNNRWGWIPGSPSVHPIWSPALVVFAGGIHFGGVGVSAWFPLGPGEAYRPWYRASPRYIDQVNITNIRESSHVHIQNTYVNVVNNVNNVTYVNQTSGVTAMRQQDFAAGRSARNSAVHVDAREMAHVQPLARPEVAPTHLSLVSRPPARPVPVSVQRPNLINQQGQLQSARPGAAPVAAPVRPAPPQARPIPGRTIVAAPAHVSPVGPAGRTLNPQNGQPANPNQPGVGVRTGPQQPVQPNRIPPTAGSGERNPNQPPAINPGGQPRPYTPAPVQPGERPNQPPVTAPGGQPRPNPQQPVPNRIPPNAGPTERNPNQPPAMYPGGQPRPYTPPPVQPGERPNQPPATAPGGQPRPNPQQPVEPNRVPPGAGSGERNPYQPPSNNPNGQTRPNPQYPNQPAPGGQQPRPYTAPPAQPGERPNQPPANNPGSQARPYTPPPTQPGERPNQSPANNPGSQARPYTPPPAQPAERPSPPANRQDMNPGPPPARRPMPQTEPQQPTRQAPPPASQQPVRPVQPQAERPAPRPSAPPPAARPAPPPDRNSKPDKPKDEKKDQKPNQN